jgi:hypothetical protein
MLTTPSEQKKPTINMTDTHTEKRGTDGPLCKSWSVKDKANMSRINTQQTVVIKCGMKLRSNHCKLREFSEGNENLKQYTYNFRNGVYWLCIDS